MCVCVCVFVCRQLYTHTFIHFKIISSKGKKLCVCECVCVLHVDATQLDF